MTNEIVANTRKYWSKAANVVSSAGLLGMSVVTPIDLPLKPGAESQVVPSTATLMHGDLSTAQMRQNVLLVAEGDTSMGMIKRVADGYFVTTPFNEQKDTTNIFAVKTSEVLGCNQQGQCNQEAVKRVIDRNIASTAIPFHETMVVVKMEYPFGSTGWTPLPESKQGSTSIYTYAAVVMPEITDVNKDFQAMIDQGVASTVAHETAHSAYGLEHEGADLMDVQEKCNPTGAGDGGMCESFNEQHKSIIRARYAAFPGTYHTPVINGITTNGLAAKIEFKPAASTKQYQVQVLPYNNDGPGINLIIGDPEVVQTGIYNVLPPKFGEGNYTMLPGMTYTTRVRTTSVANSVGENDDVWGGWSERKFKTAPASSDTITLTPRPETPFAWTDSNKSNFYYETQVSGDNRFDTNPASATSFVWWNLVHGGVTTPPNSWASPKLEPGATYYFRVRPRVQGDGTPVAWSQPSSFTVAK